MPQEKNMKQEILLNMLEDSMTKTEVLEIAEKLSKHVKKIEERNIQDVQEINKALNGVLSDLKNTTTNDIESLKKELRSTVLSEIQRANSEHGNKMSEVEEKLSRIRDGKDADEDSILERLSEMIKIPTIEELKDDLPIMGSEVRDALELLPEEDENGEDQRLDASAIKGLKEFFIELFGEQSSGKTLSGGVQQPRFIDYEDLTGTKNGTNKVFTINLTPSPATSLKVYRNGQRLKLTTDYTVSGKTITLVTAQAPESDEELYAEYRV